MRRILVCLAAAVALAAGCRTPAERYERLAALQAESLERWVARDPKTRAASAIASLDAFVLRLPFDSSLDPLRARLLLRRAELLRLQGRTEEARATAELARRIGKAEAATVAGAPAGPGDAGRRIAEGNAPVPPRQPEAAPDEARKPAGPRPSLVREFLCGWAALPDRTHLRHDARGVRGTDVDFASDFGARTPFAALAFAGEIALAPTVSAGFEVSGTSFDGSGVPGEAVRFDGTEFAAGEALRARFRFMDAGFSVQALALDRPGRKVAVVSGFRALSFSTHLVSASASKKIALDAYFPMVGVAIEELAHPDGAWLRLDLRAAGFAWSQAETELRSVLLDGAFTAEFELLPTLRAAFGFRAEYHSARFSREGTDKEYASLLAGPFLGVSLRL